MTAAAPKDAFEAFSEEVRHLRTTWVLWRRLFNRAPESENELHEANEASRIIRDSSELFFRYASWNMVRGVVLDLCRLCDHKEVAGKKNLTLERILEDTKFTGRPMVEALSRQIHDDTLDLVRDPRGIKALRDRLLAHLDLDTALGTRAIARVEIDTIDRAVRSIVEFQHRIAICRKDQPIGIQTAEFYSPRSVTVPWRDAADNLLRVLAAGLDAERDRKNMTGVNH